jgi:hypothetical protein
MRKNEWTPNEIEKIVTSEFAKEFGKECGTKEKDLVVTAIFKYDYGIDTEEKYFTMFFLKSIEVLFNIDLEFTERELAELTIRKLSDAINERINVPSIVEKVH